MCPSANERTTGVTVHSDPAGNLVYAAQDNGQYGGVDNCKMCHPDIYKDWAKTEHARSFDLLVNVGKDKTPECLPCHTTGYGKGGYVAEGHMHGTKKALKEVLEWKMNEMANLADRLLLTLPLTRTNRTYGIKSMSGRIDMNATTFRFFPLKPRARAIRSPIPRCEREFTICFIPE